VRRDSAQDVEQAPNSRLLLNRIDADRFAQQSSKPKQLRHHADADGLSSAKISAHSLRYGGATMLAAAGIPQYVIAYFGGWKADSKSLQIYMHLGAEAVAQASSVMASGFMRSLTATRIRAAELAA